MKKFKFLPKHIPNALTILRIIFVPIVLVLMLVQFGPRIYTFSYYDKNILHEVYVNLNILLAVIFFIIASLTDALDGYLARKFKWVSNFGKFWDPLADKLLINSTLFAFSSSQLNFVPIWIPIIFLARDLIVDGLRFMAAQKNIVIAANWYGKIKTIVMMIAIILVFFIGVNQNAATTWYFWAVQNILLLICLVLAIVSGIIYFKHYFELQKKVIKAHV